MKIGALIVAAGKSSRMGQFKPMLPLRNSTIARQTISNFKQAKISEIVVITGFRAEELEEHLAPYAVTFLRNDAYETTYMFDSVKIGLSYLQDRVDQILFTPADIPLFSADTIRQLTESSALAAFPCYKGRTGHPIMLSSRVVPALLSDSGENGLSGALSRNISFIEKIPVSDPGILLDADTPEDYQRLLFF